MSGNVWLTLFLILHGSSHVTWWQAVVLSKKLLQHVPEELWFILTFLPNHLVLFDTLSWLLSSACVLLLWIQNGVLAVW